MEATLKKALRRCILNEVWGVIESLLEALTQGEL